MRILVVRLGAMGDVIHALPAVACLKRIPGARIAWIVDPKWAALLQGNSDVDEVLAFDRKQWASVRTTWRELRTQPFDLAVDLQGLLKSALLARIAGAGHVVGYAHPREAPAAWFYSQRIEVHATHVVDRQIELAHAAGAPQSPVEFNLPSGSPEGTLPAHPFVLTCPLAGWRSKQWPLEYYTALVQRGVPLVVNGPPSAQSQLAEIEGAQIHLSGIEGLIDATRRASAVIGIDSGPLHLAAALHKPGVAIFGPTDPARNGPYGGSLRVLRAPNVETTYRRDGEISPAMRAITPDQVIEALP